MSILFISGAVAVSIIAIIFLTAWLKLKAFMALFIVSLFLAFATLPANSIVTTIKEGFGNTMGSIGFLIIIGVIIGIILDRTGATLSIAGYILSKTGDKKSARALGITGFITGLPIFCDSGYIILSGLAKSFSARSNIAIAFMATILATSLYSVHCLIPPHPGALAAAGIFNVNIGHLIVAGIIFAIPGTLASYIWSKWVTGSKKFPVAESPGNEYIGIRDDLPPVLLSFLPVAVPLILITIKSLISLFDKEGITLISKIFYFPGEPVFALSIGAIIGLFIIREKSIESFNSVFTDAIEKAGPILIVTAAGGMFGMVIKATGVGEEMGRLLTGTGIGLLVPFLIAAVMKTAQGSSTVAIITAASFVAPMLPALALDSEWGRLLAMLSMGAGSMVVSHANDSYFWVVSNFAGLDINTTLKVYSPATLIMGIVVFGCVWVASIFIL